MEFLNTIEGFVRLEVSFPKRASSACWSKWTGSIIIRQWYMGQTGLHFMVRKRNRRGNWLCTWRFQNWITNLPFLCMKLKGTPLPLGPKTLESWWKGIAVDFLLKRRGQFRGLLEYRTQVGALTGHPVSNLDFKSSATYISVSFFHNYCSIMYVIVLYSSFWLRVFYCVQQL